MAFDGFALQFARAIGQQTRVSLSSPDVRRENLDIGHLIKVLIIGETGSGKSTFINYLTNFFKRGVLNKPKIAIPSNFHQRATENYDHNEQDVHDKTKSKTDSCNQYIFIHEGSQYLFLDTPGLSDTRGCEQDRINIEKIINAVETLAGLTAVIIVVNGAVARLTVNLRNVIAQMRGNLPDIVMDNVIVVLTNATRHSSNFPLEALGLTGNIYPYYMQNSAFSTDPSAWTSAARASLQREWDQSMSEIKAMVRTLNKFKTKSVSAFQEMREIRNTIKSLMHNARVAIAQMQKMQDEIAMFEAGLKQARNDTVTYKDYTKERVVDDIEIVDANHHSTLCQHCNHVCHNNCGLTETTIKGSQIFQQCCAITDGNCTQCQHKCSYTAHYHAKKTVRVTKKTLKDVLADIKSKYDAASQDTLSYQKNIKSTTEAKELLEKAIELKKSELMANCRKLRQICSGFNLATELHILIEQIRIDARLLRNIEAKTQAQALIRSLEEFCERMAEEQDHQREQMEQRSSAKIIETGQHLEDQANAPYPSISSSRFTHDQNDELSLSASESHATDDVVSQIRAISERHTGKASYPTEGKRVPTNPAAMVHNDDSDDESDKNRNSSSAQNHGSTNVSLSTNPTDKLDSSMQLSVESVKTLSTQDLLARYRANNSDHRTAQLIFTELTWRSHGKSVGPMTDPAALNTYTKSLQQYSSWNYNALQQRYDELKSKISNLTEQDIVQIEKVPMDWLYEIAAIYQSWQHALRSQSENPPNILTSQSPSLSVYDSRMMAPTHQTLNQRTIYPTEQSSPHSLIPHPHPHPSLSYPSHLAGESAYLFRPSTVPQYSQSSLNFANEPPAYDPRNSYMHLPPLNAQMGPPRNRDSAGTFQQQQPDPYTAQRTGHYTSIYQHPSDIRYSPSSNASYPNHTHARILPVRASPLDQFTNTVDTMYITSPFKPVSNDHHHSTSSSPTQSISTSSSYTELSAYRHSPATFPRDIHIEELRRLTDDQLMSAYRDAIKNNNISRKEVIHVELEKRCFGDHPLLIAQEKALFEEKLRSFHGRSLQELNELKNTACQRIKTIVDGDPTNLTDIPIQRIVEAAALNHCIKLLSQ